MSSESGVKEWRESATLHLSGTEIKSRHNRLITPMPILQ